MICEHDLNAQIKLNKLKISLNVGNILCYTNWSAARPYPPDFRDVFREDVGRFENFPEFRTIPGNWDLVTSLYPSLFHPSCHPPSILPSIIFSTKITSTHSSSPTTYTLPMLLLAVVYPSFSYPPLPSIIYISFPHSSYTSTTYTLSLSLLAYLKYLVY